MIANIVATAIILIGVAIESFGGNGADDTIRQMRAPRTLTEAQQSSIAERLKSFGRHEMYVYPLSDVDPEIAKIAVDLTKVCSRAGWSYCGFDPAVWPAVPQTFRSPDEGILIVVSPAAPDPTVKPAADLLASMLHDEGLQARVSTAFSSPQPPADNRLKVYVYTK
jgi:hypothetical protein